MKLYSTNNPQLVSEFEEAVFQALPKDRGLYMPRTIPTLDKSFWNGLPSYSLAEIAFEVSSALLGDVIDEADMHRIVDEAISFPAPLIELGGLSSAKTFVLELFHGPTLAFKDFGARFMSGVMSHLLRARRKRLIILVATSGDTGGAVASGFQGRENIDVVILYPAGAVSDLQEAQLTTVGSNVTALRVDGNFDDCQALVKQSFIDQELRSSINISSANSINILRLIPQMFYYIDAYRQWKYFSLSENPVFVVPSGNFGNLTAGLLAQRMGLPVKRFVAATNQNDTVTRYAESGMYQAMTSIPTLSNAMDVGSPSNFARMQDLFGSTWNTFKEHVYAASFDDLSTEHKMRDVFSNVSTIKGKTPYVLDPHTAVGMLALDAYRKEVADDPAIVLATAHPGKFQPDVERILDTKLDLPQALLDLKSKKRELTDVPNEYEAIKEVVERVWSTKNNLN